jgi:hypothetical protein
MLLPAFRGPVTQASPTGAKRARAGQHYPDETKGHQARRTVPAEYRERPEPEQGRIPMLGGMLPDGKEIWVHGFKLVS